MMPARYLFIIGESESHFVTTEEPTPSDLEGAAVGVLSIVRLSDLHVFSRGARWQPISAGVTAFAAGELVHTHPDRR